MKRVVAYLVTGGDISSGWSQGCTCLWNWRDGEVFNLSQLCTYQVRQK